MAWKTQAVSLAYEDANRAMLRIKAFAQLNH